MTYRDLAIIPPIPRKRYKAPKVRMRLGFKLWDFFNGSGSHLSWFRIVARKTGQLPDCEALDEYATALWAHLRVTKQLSVTDAIKKLPGWVLPGTSVMDVAPYYNSEALLKSSTYWGKFLARLKKA